MLDNEKVINYLEEQIPELAELAIKQAYWQALASGSSVLAVKDNILIEVFPDGSKKIIKQLEPAMRVKPGQILEAKW
jgi:hypothetical protein